jgi:peptidoglycan/xylan/chitin deacetylase (PgdA/CDA1 family)
MRIPGLKGLRLSARWLRSRFVNGALILGYHRVAGVAQDPFATDVTPQYFDEQLEVLHRCACPISLRELVQRLRDGNLPRRSVSLTFDDGYADNLYYAKPLLERYQIPATVFVATGYVGREFWWDELERMLLSPTTLPEKLSLSINGGIYGWVLRESSPSTMQEVALSPARRLLRSLYPQLLPMPDAERQQVLAQLWAWTGADGDLADRVSCRGLTAAELIELARGSLIDIGAHSVTHPLLAKCLNSVQRAEIVQSKTFLEELLRQSVTSFAYPNGSSSQETLAIVTEAGFNCACASFNDVVWSGSDCYHLPRFWVPNWDGATFSRWLARWLPL